MTNNSNDVIAPTAQAARLAVTSTYLPCSKAALPSAFPFLVFTSLHLAEICLLVITLVLFLSHKLYLYLNCGSHLIQCMHSGVLLVLCCY